MTSTGVFTDLYRAGILRIVQKSDGAVVFSVQIPDAATHESTQHLLTRLAGLRPGPEQKTEHSIEAMSH